MAISAKTINSLNQKFSLAPANVNSFRKIRKVTHNIVSKSAEDLKKEGDLAYAAKVAEEDKLLAAVDAGKITDKKLLKTAESIRKSREKMKAREADKSEKTEVETSEDATAAS